MKYLFWNTHKNDKIDGVLKDVIVEKQPDIIGLAEYKGDSKKLVELLKEAGYKYTFFPKLRSRIDLLYRDSKLKHGPDSDYYTIKIFLHENESFVVSFVHFPSKMYDEPEANQELIEDMLDEIHRECKKESTSNILILGDFNMNPFEKNMTCATGFHAIRNRNVIEQKKGKRQYRGKIKEFLYNPMWNFLGENLEPEGSYYYASPGNEPNYWNVYDQFLVSKALMQRVNVEDIRFLNQGNCFCLSDKKGRPKVSDHFPLFFEIREESSDG